MKRHTSLLLTVLLVAMLACAIPGGQAAAPVSTDPDTISTIVASTANAAASQTAVAQPTVTPVPRKTGTAMEPQPDGTTRYSDFDAGFDMLYPVGWLAVRPNSDEFNAALVTAAADNALLNQQMTADLAGYEAPYDRVYSYALRPDLVIEAMLGFSKLVWDPADTRPIDDATMGELVQGLETSGVLPGFRADTAQVRENSNAVMTIEIGGHFSWIDAEGSSIPFYVTILFFKPSPASLCRMTFTVLQDYNAQVTPDVRSIIESISLLYPYE